MPWLGHLHEKGLCPGCIKIVDGLAFGDHVLRHHVKPRVRVHFAPGRHDEKRTQRPVTHVDNATDHHAWVVLRLLVEHVLGEPLVSGGEVFRHPSVDPHALVL